MTASQDFFGSLLNSGAKLAEGLVGAELQKKTNPQPTISPTKKVNEQPSSGQFGSSVGGSPVGMIGIIVGVVVVLVVLVVLIFRR